MADVIITDNGFVNLLYELLTNSQPLPTIEAQFYSGTNLYYSTTNVTVQYYQALNSINLYAICPTSYTNQQYCTQVNWINLSDTTTSPSGNLLYQVNYTYALPNNSDQIAQIILNLSTTGLVEVAYLSLPTNIIDTLIQQDFQGMFQYILQRYIVPQQQSFTNIDIFYPYIDGITAQGNEILIQTEARVNMNNGHLGKLLEDTSTNTLWLEVF